MAMKLSTGKVAFPIEFDNGDKDCIYFNPNDPDLATRLMATKDKISARMKDMNFDDVQLANNGEPIKLDTIKSLTDLTDEQIEEVEKKAEAIAEIVTQTKNIVCEELNVAFGSDVSSVVFKHCSPFAIVDGNYFIMNFLEAIVPEIKKYINKADASVQEKMQRHIGKYQK